ncbi:MAG: hypothetical protein ABSD75_06805 [Terriglobales bacterium]
MTFALVTAAALRRCLVAFGLTAARAILAAAILLAFVQGRFHVLAFAARLAFFRFTLVFAAARRGVLGISRIMMAATFAVFHVGHVAMTASFGFRRRSRVRRRWRRRVFLRPSNQREAQNQSKQSEFHKSSLLKL